MPQSGRRPQHQKPMRRYELVYFCSEHIENAEASRGARVCLLVHDINSELHPLAVDVQSCDRSAFRDPIKALREYSSCVISARQLYMPRRFRDHRLLRLPRPVLTSSREALAHPLARQIEISAKWWSEWQDLPSSLSTIDFLSFFSVLARFGGRGRCT